MGLEVVKNPRRVERINCLTIEGMEIVKVKDF
jgi:hypothetical protein